MNLSDLSSLSGNIKSNDQLKKPLSNRFQQLYKITSSNNLSSRCVPPNAQQQILKSYEDPYREERFIELGKGEYKQFRYKKISDENTPENQNDSISSRKGANKSNKNSFLKVIQSNNTNLPPLRPRLRSKGNLNIDNTNKSKEFFPKLQKDISYIQKEGGNILKDIDTYLSPKSNKNSQFSSKRNISKSNNSLFNKTNNNFSFAEDQENQKVEASRRILEDSKTNRHLKIICQILSSEVQPIVKEAQSLKFFKHIMHGKRGPTYFHHQ